VISNYLALSVITIESYSCVFENKYSKLYFLNSSSRSVVKNDSLVGTNIVAAYKLNDKFLPTLSA